MIRDQMETKPVFSIVMPVFNAEKYLEKAVKSVLAQKFTCFQLILINDASTDNSLEKCQKLEKSDFRITVISLPKNGGAARARNMALKLVTGTYLCFVDADDYVDPDYLQNFYEAMQERDYDLVKCGVYEEYFNTAEDMLYSRTCQVQEKVSNGSKDIVNQVIDMDFGYLVNGVYKTELVRRYGLRFDETLKVNEDFLFNMLYLPHVKTMKCLAAVTYHYAKRNNTSLSSQQTNYDYDKHLLKVKSLLQLVQDTDNGTGANLDKIYWLFTRFTFAAIGVGTSLEQVRGEEIFALYKKHRFGPLGAKQKILTGILQSDQALLIKPAAYLMNFVKQHLPVLFARIKR